MTGPAAAPEQDLVDIPITLRAGVEHRWHIPNFVVLSHVYGQKPRFKWLTPLPPDPAPPKPKRKVRDVKRKKQL